MQRQVIEFRGALNYVHMSSMVYRLLHVGSSSALLVRRLPCFYLGSE